MKFWDCAKNIVVLRSYKIEEIHCDYATKDKITLSRD